MSTIFGDGGIRRAPEPSPGLPPDALVRARELARRLAAILEARSTPEPLEAARLLVEVRRLPAEAQEGFLAAAAAGTAPEARAETVREQIARAYPEGSDRRRKLGAAFLSLEGGEPEVASPSLLEAKVTGALGKLGAVASPVRSLPADTMERSRGFGLFGGSPAPLTPAPLPSAVPEPSAATLWRVDDLANAPLLASPVAPFPSTGGPDVPAAWQGVLARAKEIAPGLTSGIAAMGRAESAVNAVQRGLTQVGEGKGVWARARAAAGQDAVGRIAGRLEKMRDQLGNGLEAAASRRDPARIQSLAGVAHEIRGEAVEVRHEIARARELVPDVQWAQAGSAPGALGSAEEDMLAAEYGLHAYETQQDMVSSPAKDPQASSADRPPGDDRARALTPEMITPEVIEELRASGQVPPEVIAQLEAGHVTPELLAQFQGGSGARISQAELQSIGTGITETPAQGFWNIGTVGAGMDPAIFNGDEYSQKAAEATSRALPDPTTVRAIDGADLAAAIRDMGVPLEKVDPSQLQAAVDFINTRASGAVEEFGRGAPKSADEQRERMVLALRQTRYLAEHGAASMDRQTAINLCWSAARIPGHAFQGMSDAEVRAVAQQTAAACNTPGNHEFKVGKHTVKLTIGENNTVKSTSTKPPSVWGKIGRVAKVVLTVASFLPPPVGLVARGIQAGIALVNAIRNGGGFLDIVAAAASFVGAGASAIGGIAKAGSNVARIAGNVARVARSVSGAARGVQGIRRGGVGGVLSGVAGVANGIAGGIQAGGGSSAAGSVSSGFSNVGRVLGQVGAGVGAAENYIHANRAVNDARKAVEQARASGDPAMIQRAEKQLAEAERGKRSAVLGGLATAGQIAANTLSRNSAGRLDPRTGQVSEQGRSGFQVGAEIFSRSMNAARGVNDRDFLTAGVEVLGAAAAARQGTKPIAQEYIIDPDGRRIPVIGRKSRPGGVPEAGRL